MYVAAILKEKGNRVVTTGAKDNMRHVASLLEEHRIGAVVVLDEGGGVTGIISERDIVRGLGQYGSRMLDLPVHALMTTSVVTCTLEDSIDSMMELMTRRRFRHVPVVEDGALIGIISIGDVVKNRLAECTMEVDSLKEYVATSR